jgi:WXG100 family type VII secretion target
MSGLNVETSAMQAAIKAFENSSENLASAMKQLQQDINSQLNSQTYKGAQATAFNQVCMRIDDDLTKASSSLNDMSQTMTQVFSNYQRGDSEAQAEFSKLGNISDSASSVSQGAGGPALANPTISRLSGL